MNQTAEKIDPSKFTKLWQLLELGLHDLAMVELTPGVIVDMSTWLHYGDPDVGEDPDKCSVCLAGSVLYRTLGGRRNFWDGTSIIPDWAMALDMLRTGRVRGAKETIDANFPDKYLPVPDRRIEEYWRDKSLWWAKIRLLLADLKAADL